jgi:sporulation protein YlmC with PRC-barrel domain
MSRKICLHHLVGRTVHDVDGRRIGRIQEILAEIELHEHGNEYVVREFHIGAFGLFEALAGSRFAQRAMKRLEWLTRYRIYVVPWQLMDLSDLARPRVSRSLRELATVSS